MATHEFCGHAKARVVLTCAGVAEPRMSSALIVGCSQLILVLSLDGDEHERSHIKNQSPTSYPLLKVCAEAHPATQPTTAVAYLATLAPAPPDCPSRNSGAQLTFTIEPPEL